MTDANEEDFNPTEDEASYQRCIREAYEAHARGEITAKEVVDRYSKARDDFLASQSEEKPWADRVTSMPQEDLRYFFEGVNLDDEKRWPIKDIEFFRYPPRITTASVIHDGTWKFERQMLERYEAAASSTESCVLWTVHDRPRGFRGCYLGCRSRLWKLRREIRRQGSRCAQGIRSLLLHSREQGRSLQRRFRNDN